MGRVYRISDGGWHRGPVSDHARWIKVADDSGRLYDEAHGPKAISRPIRNGLVRRPDEWNDPYLDAVILRVDALAAVDKTKARIDAGNYGRDTHSDSLKGFEHWLHVEDVALRCGVTPQSVYGWRHRNTGPLSARFGGTVRWDPQSVDNYARQLDRQRAQGTRTPRPDTPTGPWHITRHTAVGVVYWTGIRWSADPAAAKTYRQLPVATSIARGLNARTQPAD